MTQITIEKLTHEGRGIGYYNGKTVFVDGALPGETATVRFTKKKRQYMEAAAQSISTPSPDRVQPACPHFGTCGGCQLQYLPPNRQIDIKQAAFLEQLHQFGRTQPAELLPPVRGPYWGYRRKARLGAKYVPQKQKLVLGFREKHNPAFINDSYTCLVLVPELGQKIDWLASQLQRTGICDAIPQIEIAAGDSGLALVVRHLRALDDKDQAILNYIGSQTGWSIYLQPGKPETVHRLYPTPEEAYLSYALPRHDITINFHPMDFVQVNGPTNRQLVDSALNLLRPQPDEHVLDLFCGLGNFALPAARRAGQVTGIEGEQTMVARAQYNARFNGLTNTGFYTADLNEPLQSLTAPVDKVLLDPPRTGASAAIEQLVSHTPKRFVYISCNPATLARDAGLLKQRGYDMTQAGVVDMFPHTRHVECIAAFEPRD